MWAKEAESAMGQVLSELTFGDKEKHLLAPLVWLSG